MKKKTSWLRYLAFTGIALTTLLAPSHSQAGKSNTSVVCVGAGAVTGAEGGYCSGPFAGFRNNSDPNAFAYFVTDNRGSHHFAANINGKGGFCEASDPSIVAMWPMAMAHKGSFYITWDQYNNCTYLQLYNGSDSQSSW
jgi:hypothetical protein